MPNFATPFMERKRVSYSSALPSRTMQQFATEADVNVLIDRYKKTGSFYNPLTPQTGEPRRPMFEDISSLPSIDEAQEAILAAQEVFLRLPATVREQFGHNPALFVAWAQDPANLPALAKLGVIELPVVQQEPPEGGDKPAPASEEHKQTSGASATPEKGGAAS